jgi:hypothetical protein
MLRVLSGRGYAASRSADGVRTFGAYVRTVSANRPQLAIRSVLGRCGQPDSARSLSEDAGPPRAAGVSEFLFEPVCTFALTL